MAFSVSTSWLLPMNDRLHVRICLRYQGAAYVHGSEKTEEASRYIGTLPEYSIVEAACFFDKKNRATGASMITYIGAVVYGAEPSLDMPFGNLVRLDMKMSMEQMPGAAREGVGFRIPARDVQHAVLRIVPDISEIRTEADLDHYHDEMDAIDDRRWDMLRDLARTMPDGSIIDQIVPGGSPDPDSGALVDWPIRYIVYGGTEMDLPDVPDIPEPHLPQGRTTAS